MFDLHVLQGLSVGEASAGHPGDAFVARYKQVLEPVVVVIGPGRSPRDARYGRKSRRNAGENAGAIIAEPEGARVTSKEDVQIAIAVHVAGRAAFDHEPGVQSNQVTCSYLLEGSVAPV
jgi:hypothetical protein